MASKGAERDGELQRLKAEFHQAMLELYDVAASRGYRATRFKIMVEQYGGVGAAKRLLAKPGVQDGFTQLWELGLLAHSTEAIALQDRFQCLFTEEELAEARQRLQDTGYFTGR